MLRNKTALNRQKAELAVVTNPIRLKLFSFKPQLVKSLCDKHTAVWREISLYEFTYKVGIPRIIFRLFVLNFCHVECGFWIRSLYLSLFRSLHTLTEQGVFCFLRSYLYVYSSHFSLYKYRLYAVVINIDVIVLINLVISYFFNTNIIKAKLCL